MGRGYSAAQYLDRLNRLKKAVPGITVSTDIMVGFPGESEEDFQETLKVMREAEFDSLYLFIYSPRPGTEAAGYEGAVTRQEASKRFDRAKTLNYKIITGKNRRMVGRTVEVLCEGLYNSLETNFRETDKNWFGRTPGNSQVIFQADRDMSGKTLPVSITGVKGYNLLGKIK